jgi:MoxR-like ATPase
LEHGNPLDKLEPVVSAAELLESQQTARNIHVDVKVRRYITQIVQDTRTCDDVSLGGSPRASLALFRSSQALAALSGRNFVRPDDVKQLTGPVLTHRMILRPESRLRKLTPAAVVADVVEKVPVPLLGRDRDGVE